MGLTGSGCIAMPISSLEELSSYFVIAKQSLPISTTIWLHIGGEIQSKSLNTTSSSFIEPYNTTWWISLQSQLILAPPGNAQYIVNYTYALAWQTRLILHHVIQWFRGWAAKTPIPKSYGLQGLSQSTCFHPISTSSKPSSRWRSLYRNRFCKGFKNWYVT